MPFTVHGLFSFDIAQGIDLGHAERLLGAGGRQPPPAHRAPPSFEFRPAPLRVAIEPFGCSGHTETAEALIHDFGAATVITSIRLDGVLASLGPVASRLRTPAVAELARQRMATVLAGLGPAATRPHLVDLVEDYFIIQAEPSAQPNVGSLANRSLLAGLLRGDLEPLSPEEIDDALSLRASYRPDDEIIVDWDGALVTDHDPAEVVAVLELANVQLLELRHLDAELDRLVGAAYQAIAAPTPLGPTPHRLALRRLGELQTDAAVLFEHVSNDAKLVGDQYLGRVYRMVARRFRLDDWNRAIDRKLQTVDGIYQKLTDRSSARRLEFLEWIVILLIAAEFALAFLRRP